MTQNDIEKIITELKMAYPDSKTSLDFKNPYELLVATILSAQSTDATVNKITPALFKKFPTSSSMAQANLEDIIVLIRSVGLFNTKGKNLLEMSKKLVSDFEGNVPSTIKDLTSLPGVGRKTATAVLTNAFGITDQGITVDTHMMRVTKRLGWSTIDKKDANQVEKQLVKIIPQKYWGIITHLIIDHGRAICTSNKPKCSSCVINTLCPSSEKK